MRRTLLSGALVAALGACAGSGHIGNGSTPPLAVSPGPRLKVVAIDPQPVLEVGSSGSWDDTDVLNPSTVVFDHVLYNHYSGYSDAHWATGTAVSIDGGATWTKSAAPFLVAPPRSVAVPEPIAANGGSVAFDGRILHLYERNRSPTDARASIWLATSRDGVAWDTSAGEVLAGSGVAGTFDEDQVADPYVVKVGGTLYLYYTGVPTANYRVLIGVATSTDGVHWTRRAGPLLPQGAAGMIDEFYQGEPAVVFTGKAWYMLYVGDTNENLRSIGWASSTDGIAWVRQSTTESIVPATQRLPWFASMMIDPDIRQEPNADGTYTVFFGGGTTTGNQKIQGRIGRMFVRFD